MNLNNLYIHIPFCERKCFYCSFNSFPAEKNIIDQYLECLNDEMKYHKNKKVSSIYIGGGTPSLLSEMQLKHLFKNIYSNFSFDKKNEFTVEVNPESFDFRKAKILSENGCNRLSIGIQSLNNKYLKFLGRLHDNKKAIFCYQLAKRSGIKNINLDFMYGFPNQSIAELKKDVIDTIKLKSVHLSLYSLSIEEKSLFHIKKLQLPSKEIQAKQFNFIVKALTSQGYNHYEISNFAYKGYESVHNINYWKGGNYIGIGLGAHSHQNGKRYWNKSKLSEYINDIRRHDSPVDGFETLNKEARLMEAFLFGLRMKEGVNIKNLEKKYKCKFEKSKINLIKELDGKGFFDFKENQVKTTEKGILVLDELCCRLI